MGFQEHSRPSRLYAQPSTQSDPVQTPTESCHSPAQNPPGTTSHLERNPKQSQWPTRPRVLPPELRSHPIPQPAPLLSACPLRLRPALSAGFLQLLTHARETPLGVFVLAVFPVICSNSWFTLSLHWGLGSNVTSSERAPLSTYLKLYEEEMSPVLGISASPTPCPVPGT